MRVTSLGTLHGNKQAQTAAFKMAAQSASPSRVTPLEHTMIGAVGGVMEVCLMQPMVAFKNALQEGRPLPRTPTQMYRGLLVSSSELSHLQQVAMLRSSVPPLEGHGLQQLHRQWRFSITLGMPLCWAYAAPVLLL